MSKMSEQRPKLTVNSSIIERVYSEVKRTPDYEIGGRFFGKIFEDGSLRVDEFMTMLLNANLVISDRHYNLGSMIWRACLSLPLQTIGV